MEYAGAEGLVDSLSFAIVFVGVSSANRSVIVPINCAFIAACAAAASAAS
jgi:hypothetical protein